ncbi:MAG: hypothetical protein ACOYN0_17315 [Phycisphaerales bacterium]
MRYALPRVKSGLRKFIVAPAAALGASVLIAWAFKLLYVVVPATYTNSGTFQRESAYYSYYAWDLPGRTSVTAQNLPIPVGRARPTGALANWSDGFRVPSYTRLSTEPGVQIANGAYGWPFRCLRSSVRVPTTPGGGGPVYQDQLMLSPTFRPSGLAASLPLRPIWTGLLGNTAFWLLAWGVWRHGGARVRATARRRRGVCTECGYDLKGDYSTGCPECGWGRPAERKLNGGAASENFTPG